MKISEFLFSFEFSSFVQNIISKIFNNFKNVLISLFKKIPPSSSIPKVHRTFRAPLYTCKGDEILSNGNSSVDSVLKFRKHTNAND